MSTSAEPQDLPAPRESAPPAAYVDGELDRVDRDVAASVQRWMDVVRRDAVDPIMTALLTIADRYETDVAEAEADPDTYRRALRERIVEPLRRLLHEKQPGRASVQAYEALLDDLEGASEGIDEHVERPEPPDLYRSSGADGVYRRLRKAGVRSRRVVRGGWRSCLDGLRRLVGARPAPEDPHVQHVPLAHLVRYHAEVRLPADLQKHQGELARVIAGALAGASTAMTEHVHDVLSTAYDVDAEEAPNGDRYSGSGESPVAERVNVEDASPASDRHRTRASASRLVGRLRAMAAELASVSVFEDVSNERSMWSERLHRDVRESDSFMLDLSKRDVGRASSVREQAERQGRAWTAWFERVHQRWWMLVHLLDLRKQTMEIERGLADRVLEGLLEPAMHAVSSAEGRLRTLSGDARTAFERRVSPDVVDGLLDEALEAVEPAALSVFEDENLLDEAHVICDEAVSELTAFVEGLPEVLELNEGGESAVVDPEAPTRRVELRVHAERAFDALLVERLRSSIDHIANAMEAARDVAKSVPEILRFNLGSARDDLRQHEEADARELVVDGLVRSADTLAVAVQHLEAVNELFRTAVHVVLDEGFRRIHQRVRVEERVHEHMLDLRSGAEARLRRTTKRVAEKTRRVAATVRSVFRVARRHLGRWVRLGQEAAGLAEVTAEKRQNTVDALAGTDRLLDEFPLVYRRLFTFAPVRDASLLIGREADLRFVGKHVERWNQGLTNALVVTGSHGGGRTSLCNVVAETVLNDVDTRWVDLRRRLHTEGELARVLADALDAPESESLDDLAEYLFSRDDDAPTLGCMIEHLEHLYLRDVGGTHLVRAFLTFVSRTDSQVLWIASVSNHGWQVIQKAESSASGLPVVHRLSPIGRADLEALVLHRHRRSGLPIRYEMATADPNPLFARRYRKARTDVEQQDVLRTEFFDRLYRSSGQHVMMALYYWLRSVEMDRENGILRVRFTEPLQFGFLESMDLDWVFTMKALLEHTSLTVEEHSDLFRVERGHSLEVFEGLGNLLLIQPMETRRKWSRFDFVTVEKDVRYRIRPLLIHPVEQFLRGRNIVH